MQCARGITTGRASMVLACDHVDWMKVLCECNCNGNGNDLYMFPPGLLLKSCLVAGRSYGNSP